MHKNHGPTKNSHLAPANGVAPSESEVTTPAESAISFPASETRDTAERPYAAIVKSVLKGLALTILLLLIKWPLEPTKAVEHLRLTTYNFMQQRLTDSIGVKPLPIVVVDISDVPLVPTDPHNRSNVATSRVALTHVLDRLVRQHPKAIGIDVDFSPDEHGYITPDDPQFFEHCQLLSQDYHVPIYLGITRSAALPKEYWLGDPEYYKLAASLVIPRENSRSMLRWTQIAGSGTPCKTLSASLADASFGSTAKVPRGFRWALELRQEHLPVPTLTVQRFLVDYSPLDRLLQERIASQHLNITRSQSLHGKVILLGDVRLVRKSDLFVIPGHTTYVPGVFLHACAIYTLLQAPLYDLTALGRLFLDILLVAVIVGIIALTQIHAVQTKKDIETEKLQIVITWTLIVATFIGGVIFVNWTRVMWDDYPLVVLGLGTHQPLEKLLENLSGRWHNRLKTL